MNSKLPTYSLLRSNPWIKIRSDKGGVVCFFPLHLFSLLTLHGQKGRGEEERQQVLYLTIPIVLIPYGLANYVLSGMHFSVGSPMDCRNRSWGPLSSSSTWRYTLWLTSEHLPLLLPQMLHSEYLILISLSNSIL